MAYRYRRTAMVPDQVRPGSFPPGASAGDKTRPDLADPYAAYLSWVADGRPPMPGAAAVRPETGTVLLTDHVQVQLQRDDPAIPALPTVPTRSAWRRLADTVRRRLAR